jgi:MerR family transcriptional regulator, light-induced transcriptional regulator
MAKLDYPIRAVSKLTGLGIDTLRAWERRYGAIKPRRTERQRVYHEADVERLILLREAVAGGHPIRKVAVLSNKALKELRQRSLALSRTPSVSAQSVTDTSGDLKILHEAIHRFDCLEFHQELDRLAATMTPRQLVHRVVVPLMSRIGDEWYLGELSVAQEHLVSGSLRNLLGSLVRVYTRALAESTLLFATPKGERHEFGILCAAMLAASGGIGVAYLGPDLPSAAIVDSAHKTKAGIVVLGVKAALSPKDSFKELYRISEALPSSIELWVGGVRSADVARHIKIPRVRYLKNFLDLERELTRAGARF